MGDGRCFVRCRLLVNVDGVRENERDCKCSARSSRQDKQRRARRLKGKNVNGGKEGEGEATHGAVGSQGWLGIQKGVSEEWIVSIAERIHSGSPEPFLQIPTVSASSLPCDQTGLNHASWRSRPPPPVALYLVPRRALWDKQAFCQRVAITIQFPADPLALSHQQLCHKGRTELGVQGCNELPYKEARQLCFSSLANKSPGPGVGPGLSKRA